MARCGYLVLQGDLAYRSRSKRVWDRGCWNTDGVWDISGLWGSG